MPAATRRWLAFVVADRRRRSSSLRATTSSRAATRSSRASRLRPRPITAASISATGPMLSAVPFRAASSSSRRAISTADGSRDLVVLGLAGRSKHRRRSGGDPLGLAGKLERCKGRRHPAFRDALDDVSDLEEGIEGGGRRQHRKGADTKESEQQTAANAETLKHARQRVGPDDRAKRSARDAVSMSFQRHVFSTLPDIPYPV